jgi:hypothetical protein
MWELYGMFKLLIGTGSFVCLCSTSVRAHVYKNQPSDITLSFFLSLTSVTVVQTVSVASDHTQTHHTQ